MTSTDDLLLQAKRALDEFADVPLEVSIRRTVRLASLLGEAEIAVRLSFELRSGKGGSIRANRTDIERLMREDEPWEGGPDAPHERAVTDYMTDRTVRDQNGEPVDPHRLYGHSITEMQFWIDRMMSIADDDDATADVMRNSFASALDMTQVVERVRHRTFTALVSMERRLAFTGTNEDIYRKVPAPRRQ